MKKFGLKAACILGVVSAMGCGGPSSQLPATNWVSATIAPDQMSNGVTASSWTIHFAAATTNPSTTASGPYTATLVETYGATAPENAGCVITTMVTGGTWTDTFSQSNDLMGAVEISGSATASTVAMCAAGVTGSAQNDLPNNAGTDAYTISGTMMTLTGDSGTPYAATWAFTKM